MNNAGEFHFCILNVLMSGLIKKPEARGDVAEWSNSLRQNKIEKQMSTLSLPPSPPPLNPRRPKKPRHFPILGLKRGFTRVGVNFQYSFVLSIIDVDLRVVCIAMWMTKHEQKPWQESGKNVCLKTAILVCNARNLLGVAFHRQFSRPILRRETGQPEPNPKGYVFFFKERALRDVWQW